MPNMTSPGTSSLNLLERIEALERHKENLDKKRLDVIAEPGKTKIGLTVGKNFVQIMKLYDGMKVIIISTNANI